MNDLKINQAFAHLDHSPIVEAIFYWQSRSNKDWATPDLRLEIQKRLPDYPNIREEKNLEIGISQSLDDTETPLQTSKKVFMGLRLQSKEEPHIALFRPDGFTFSRLRPYEEWKSFETEAIRLWRVYRELAEPSEIQRLGVRFINQIPLSPSNGLGQILRDAPKRIDDLPLKNFFYQSTLSVDAENLEIGIIKTMPQDTGIGQNAASFYLDIEVYSTQPVSVGEDSLIALLPRLKYYKNKVFFDLLTDAAIQSFRGEN